MSGYSLDRSPFFRLKSKRKLAFILQVSFSKLKKLSRDTSEYYSVFTLEDGGRLVEAPTSLLKTVHKRVYSLLSRIQVQDSIYSPRKGISIVQNAALHRGNKQLYKVDIKKYFPSIKKRKIYWFFHKRMECSADVAGILAQILTIDGHLSTGSPASPILSYFANLDMWAEIESLALANKCVLSVWVDDICISGDKISDFLIWRIRNLIRGHGLIYHKESMLKTKAIRVTGIIVSGHRLMAPKATHKKLYTLRRKLKNSSDPSRCKSLSLQIAGIENYISEIEKY
jgi:hypothetical protein